MASVLPCFTIGKVVQGFGRGSRQLGIPTANYAEDVVKNLPETLDCGVYYGWAQVDNGDVHKMVMNIGWCPFYRNKLKSMETHILHDFAEDFYGSTLKTLLLGYIRPEKSFDGLNDLITAIKNDIAQAKTLLDLPAAHQYKGSNFFRNGFTHSLL
ncbi:PREDICTED: putative riboflavin kinase [Priapulus caudatus]|uniref:riboflavin kinase n=1 Tax=Priapulus caudatus TaxID=37621 RepID=A0ABM1EB82_PRICU|nr:PREDICTED: putative riboflavin kinase [Priapulus caudatus]